MLCVFQNRQKKLFLILLLQRNGKYFQFQIDNCSNFHIIHLIVKTSHECQTMYNNLSTDKLWITSTVNCCVRYQTDCTYIFLCYLAINKKIVLKFGIWRFFLSWIWSIMYQNTKKNILQYPMSPPSFPTLNNILY